MIAGLRFVDPGILISRGMFTIEEKISSYNMNEQTANLISSILIRNWYF